MAAVVYFYSRTDATRAVAERVARALDCACEEIVDTKKRDGYLGFARSSIEALTKRTTVIKPLELRPSLGDLCVIGTPVWSRNISVPMRTFLKQNRGEIGKVAFFCTERGRGGPKVFRDMGRLLGRQPVAVLELIRSRVLSRDYEEPLNGFIADIERRYGCGRP